MKALPLLFLLLPLTALPQMEARFHPDKPEEGIEVARIPPDILLDSLVHYIYNFNPSKYGIAYSQKFGWLKPSDQFDSNAFFEWAKQYCIERVGEAYFYDHFRVNRRSFKDHDDSEIYEIRFYFFPPGFAYDHVQVVFKKFVFLGIEEVETPAHLPDCRSDTTACTFPITRQRAKQIARQQVLKDRDMHLLIKGLTDDLKWEGQVYTDGRWYGESFTIDARTGDVTTPKAWRRID